MHIFLTVLRKSICVVVDLDIIVRELELQPCNYVHFQTNLFGKGMNFLITSAIRDKGFYKNCSETKNIKNIKTIQKQRI